MTEDARLLQLLRSAVPPIVELGSSVDRWPLVVRRRQKRKQWSWLDVALAAIALTALLARLDWLVLLAYHF